VDCSAKYAVRPIPCAITLHLSGAIKDGFHRKQFADADDDDAITVAVKKWILETDSAFYRRGM
jgi:hypothetical protein